MEFNLIEVLLVIIIMTAGTSLQSTVGFGLGLVAGPLLVLIDRAYLPAPLLCAAVVLTMLMVIRERKAIDPSGFKFSVTGRLISTPPAAMAVGFLSATAFDIVFGCLILVAVCMSLIHREIKPTGRNVFIAAIASGFMSTIGAIGGPPMALVYQNSRGPELRATLAGLFLIGCLLSLIALAIVGEFTIADLGRGGILIVGVLIGLLVSKPLISVLDKNSIRPYVLGVCTISALIVLGRAIIVSN